MEVALEEQLKSAIKCNKMQSKMQRNARKRAIQLICHWTISSNRILANALHDGNYAKFTLRIQ